MGGLLSGAMIGAAEGLGSGLSEGSKLSWKDEHERMREQATAAREERNIALKGEADRALEQQKGHVVAPGSTLMRAGQPDFQAPAAPEKALTEEDRRLKTAEALSKEAYARYLDREKDKTTKEPKPTLPKFVQMKDEQGNVIGLVDEHSGALGVPTPGQPAQEGSAPWYTLGMGTKTGGKPAQAANIQWSLNGQALPNGLTPMYPDMVNRGVGEGSGAPSAPASLPDPLGLRSSLPRVAPAPKPAGIIAPAVQSPAPLPVSQFLTQQRGRFLFNAGPRSSAAAKQLNGRGFSSAQEAQDAYDALLNQ